MFRESLIVGVFLAGLIGFAAWCISTAKAIEAERPQEIRLQSPNGRFRITIAAADEAAGIWVEDMQAHKAAVVVLGRQEQNRFIAVQDSRKAPAFALTEDGLKDQSEFAKKNTF